MNNNWRTDDITIISTPFNIENILRSDPMLYAKWKENPFTLDIDEDGFVIVRYVVIDMDEEGLEQ